VFGIDPGRHQIGLWIMATFRSTEVWYLQWRDGQLSDELWLGNREAVKWSFISHQITSDYWAANRGVFAPDFQREVDELQRAAILQRTEWLAQLPEDISPKPRS
jgi:hypothetical protein